MKQDSDKIYNYMLADKLDLERIITDYSNYVYTVARNSYNILSKEDIEEVVLDVFMTLWKNTNKLDVNKSMSAYISGITKNLIKYKNRQTKDAGNNIDDFADKIIELEDVELVAMQNEREKVISKELDLLKSADREVFIEYYYSRKKH